MQIRLRRNTYGKKSLKKFLSEIEPNRRAAAGKNKMFEGNEKILKAFRTEVLILTIVLEILFFVGVTIACVDGDEGSATIAVMLMILVAISYAAMRLTFSFLVDVKAIRNKLYGIKNDDLLKLDSAERDSENGQAQIKIFTGAKSIDEKAEELLSLKKLLDEKVITEEEFETEKKKFYRRKSSSKLLFSPLNGKGIKEALSGGLL